MINLASLKWSKNVNYQGSFVFWTFPIEDISKIFLLHWRKTNKQNARKPKEGELIILRQHGCVTHIVKVFNDTLYHGGSDAEFNIGRLIEVVWVANDLKNPPNYQEVFGCPIRFPQGGRVHPLENNNNFQEHWDKQGGLEEFQNYVKGVLDKYGEWKELLTEL